MPSGRRDCEREIGWPPSCSTYPALLEAPFWGSGGGWNPGRRQHSSWGAPRWDTSPLPDHSTIAEFRRRHEAEIAELFDHVLLGLCPEAALPSVGVITIDGTKIKANASMDQNRSYRKVLAEILRKAEKTDRREDEPPHAVGQALHDRC
jgi:hypothetical protein